jgi:hypothetical protein
MEAEKKKRELGVFEIFVIAGIIIIGGAFAIFGSDDKSQRYDNVIEAVASDKAGEYTIDWKANHDGYVSEITKLDVADDGEITVFFTFNNDSGETYSNDVKLDAVLNREQIKGSIWFSDHPKGKQLDGTTHKGSIKYRGGEYVKESGNEMRVLFEVGPEGAWEKKEYEVTLKF